MTVKQLREILEDWDDDMIVTMVQCNNDNPMTDDVDIKKAVALISSEIEHVDRLVIFPA